jgi:1,4-alpha-glucan branching enzyme
MYGHPGKKLLFMGSEIGNWDEWNHESGLPWEVLQFDFHRKLQTFVGALNHLYRSHPAFYEVDFHWGGFEWVDFRDVDGSTISLIRRPKAGKPFLLFVCNFTPVPRLNYRVGVPEPGYYREILNSDAEMFGGSNVGNAGLAMAEPIGYNDRFFSLSITLPPLAVVVFESPS